MNKILYTKELYDRLKLIQETYHDSSYEMSIKLGYSSKYVSSLVVDKNYLSTTFLNKLEAAYGIDATAFISGVGFSLEKDKEGLSARLKSLKGDQTSTKVARDIGINPYRYIHYEEGEEYPTSKQVKRIAEYFNVGVDWLLYGDELDKDNPVNDRMIQYLKEHPEIRKQIWEEINKAA